MRVPDTEVKPPKIPPHAQVRIWFWNNAGAFSFLCPTQEARHHQRRLIAAGCVVWHTDVYTY